MRINVTMRGVHVTIVALITYSECVSVALVIQPAERMLLIIVLNVACLAPTYFSTSAHKRHNYR
jgi:hypothetical protein